MAGIANKSSSTQSATPLIRFINDSTDVCDAILGLVKRSLDPVWGLSTNCITLLGATEAEAEEGTAHVVLSDEMRGARAHDVAWRAGLELADRGCTNIVVWGTRERLPLGAEYKVDPTSCMLISDLDR